MLQPILLSLGISALPELCVVTGTLLFGGVHSAAPENRFRIGEDRGGVKKHPEGSEKCGQGDLGENVVPQSAVTGSWPQPAAAKPGVLLASAH